MRKGSDRNKPCYCGSGEKFKRCCMDIKPMTTTNTENLMTGRPTINAEFQGKKVVAVGSRLYHSLPINMTFHEFLIFHFQQIVGSEWLNQQAALPVEKQHILYKWLIEIKTIISNTAGMIKHAPHLYSAQNSGNTQSFLSLAHDIYSLYHCTELPPELLHRLLNEGDQFQGAKYEIAVAAIFAKAEFTIEWIPNTGPDSHCEFVATHTASTQKVIVEAKSRHHAGYLQNRGEAKAPEQLKARLGTLLNRAVAKPTNGLPFFIFIDVNMPFVEGDNPLEKGWGKDAKKKIGEIPPIDENAPRKFNAIFITNFPAHFNGATRTDNRNEHILVMPQKTQVTLDESLIFLIDKAVNEYGHIPELFPK